MRTTNVLISSIHLILFIFVLAVGIFFVCLPYAPGFGSYLIETIFYNPFIFLKIGIIILFFALLLFIGFFMLYKKSYLKIKMKPFAYSIDSPLISSYVKSCLEEVLPNSNIQIEVVIHSKDKIEIIIPFIEKDDDFYKELEEKIGKFLFDKINYQKEFFITFYK